MRINLHAEASYRAMVIASAVVLSAAAASFLVYRHYSNKYMPPGWTHKIVTISALEIKVSSLKGSDVHVHTNRYIRQPAGKYPPVINLNL